MKRSWFAVKTLFIQEAKGKVLTKDKDYLKGSVTLEERIVLYFAKNFSEAIKAGERDAKKYAKELYRNIYGETVYTYYTGCYDSFELFENPGNGVEVFGVIDIFLNKSSAKKAMKVKAGVVQGKKDSLLRKRFRYA